MDTEFRNIALKPDISKEEWERLVHYLKNDQELALASRMFYFLNQHNTHTFDYFVPDLMEQINVGRELAEYRLRAKHLFTLLANKLACGNIWYLAAQIIAPLNLSDWKLYGVVKDV